MSKITGPAKFSMHSIWIILAAVYWLAVGLSFWPVGSDLFSSTGFVPRPEYNFSSRLLPIFKIPWLTSELVLALVALLLISTLLLLTRWNRAGAALIWIVMFLFVNRNNMIESAEVPIWGLLFLAWAIWGIQSSWTWALMIFNLGVFILANTLDQIRAGFFLGLGLKEALLNSFMLRQNWESSVGGLGDFAWSALGTTVVVLQILSLLLLLARRYRKFGILIQFFLFSILLLILDLGFVGWGLLIWLVGILVYSKSTEPKFKIIFKIGFSQAIKMPVSILLFLGLVFVSTQRPWGLSLETPKSGWTKSLNLSALPYPLAQPYRSDGFTGATEIELYNIDGEKKFFLADRSFFRRLDQNQKLRVFSFNSLNTFYRMNPGLSVDIFKRAFCQQSAILVALGYTQKVYQFVVRRKAKIGEDSELEVDCRD